MVRMKKQDVPAVGRMVLQSFIRDKAWFVAFSHLFDGGFEDEMRAAIVAVKDRRRPIDVYGKQKGLTMLLHRKLDVMKEQLRLLGDYVRLAEGDLLSLYGHYHIKEARMAAHSRSVKCMLEECEQVIDKFSVDDSVALEAVGFDAGKRAGFVGLVEEIRVLYMDRNAMASERRNVRALEVRLFAEMWRYVGKVVMVGKSLFTYREKYKYNKYSVSHMLRRLNHGMTKRKGKAVVVDDVGIDAVKVSAAVVESYNEVEDNVLVGRVLNGVNDDGVVGVEVRLDGGDVVGVTNVNGEFYIDGVMDGVYSLWFGKLGYGEVVRNDLVVGGGVVCFVDDVSLRPVMGVVV